MLLVSSLILIISTLTEIDFSGTIGANTLTTGADHQYFTAFAVNANKKMLVLFLIVFFEFGVNCKYFIMTEGAYMPNGANALRGATPRPPSSKEPYFDSSAPQNVSALIGKSAYLTCKVRNIGNRTVSWVRHRDIHILTVSTYTYTSDQRFMALHHPLDDDWTLQIKWVQKRDAGIYECQISTLPVQAYFINLNIVVPTATIIGGPDIYVNYGSTINLTCTITHSTEPPPAYIFWYYSKEDDNTSTNSPSTKGPVRVVSYDSERGGVSIITDKGDVTTSRLLITNALPSDEGRYSCSPSNADMATVRVHVLSGESPAAMQTSASDTLKCKFFFMLLVVLCSTFRDKVKRL